jgi:virginiamycin B lyase
MHRRLASAVLATLATCALASAPAQAAPPTYDTVSNPVTTGATFDVVNTGKYTWFSSYDSRIGRISPDGSIKYFDSGFFSVQKLAVGPNGTIWYVGADVDVSLHLGRMEQDGHRLSNTQQTTYPATGMAVGADGNMWVSTRGTIEAFDQNGNWLKEYSVLNDGADDGATVNDIVAGPDGNLWATEGAKTFGQKTQAAVLRITPAGVITRYTANIGVPCKQVAGGWACSEARHITVGPDGALWFTLFTFDGGAVGRITTSGSASYQILSAADHKPTQIVGGPDQAVYLMEPGDGQIKRVSMFSGQVSTIQLPAESTGTAGDLAGMSLAADGRIWVAGTGGNTLVRVTAAPRPTTGNLLVNASGEGLTAPGASGTVPLFGWSTSPNFTAGGFNQASGNGMLWGGPNNAISYARQLVDVSADAATIDAGTMTATAGGKIGGFGGQEDHGTILAHFLSGDGAVLSTIETAPVTPADLGGKTGYVDRTIKGIMPAGTRFVEVELLANRITGNSNDAFFDDVSFTTAPIPVPVIPPGQENGGTGNGAGAGGAGGNGGGAGGNGGSGNGGGQNGQQGQSDDTAQPAVATGIALAPASFHPLGKGGPTTTDPTAGTLLTITLTHATTVTVRFDRATKGKKKAKACVAPKKAKKTAKACTYYVSRGSFTVDQPAGKSSIHLSGRVAGKTLPKGKYRVVITPAGGAATTVALTIK